MKAEEELRQLSLQGATLTGDHKTSIREVRHNAEGTAESPVR
jgi:hypothetical protein